MFSRVLYSNPACALVTQNAPPCGPNTGARNAMTVTWLSPMDNAGHFTMSLNSGRHSLANLSRDPVFSLSPAVEGMEGLLTAIGGVSGRVVADKCARLGVQLVHLGSADCGSGAAADTSKSAADESPACALCCVEQPTPIRSPARRRSKTQSPPCAHARLRALAGAPAHLMCRVVHVLLGPQLQPLSEPADADTNAAAAVVAVEGAGTIASGDDGAVDNDANGVSAGAGASAVPHPSFIPPTSSGTFDGPADSHSSSAVDAPSPSPHSQSTHPSIGHTILLCRIVAAWVRPQYWHAGKLFCAPPLGMGTTQPFISKLATPFQSAAPGRAVADESTADALSTSTAADLPAAFVESAGTTSTEHVGPAAPTTSVTSIAAASTGTVVVGAGVVPGLLCFAGSGTFVAMRLLSGQMLPKHLGPVS